MATFVIMNKKVKEASDKRNEKDFVKEYKEIFNIISDHTVVIHTEWTKNGDYFRKLSLYDETYMPIETLGNTTLVNTL